MSRGLVIAAEVWRAEDRGRLRLDWLDARLSLNFGGWQRQGRAGFGPLLVLNDDRVAPKSGFAMHPHRDLDILMVPLTSAIEHRDSEGRVQWVRPGQVQWMRAGTGIAHSQMNVSPDRIDRHLQLWVKPRQSGLVSEVSVHDVGWPTPGQWIPLCGMSDGLFQPDAAIELLLGRVEPGRLLSLGSTGARLLQVVDGEVEVWCSGGPPVVLREGDALVFRARAQPMQVRASALAQVLRVDLPEAL